MTDKKTEALKLALEALETCVCAMQDYQAGIGITEMFDRGERRGRETLIILREALAQDALDKMAENARELGLGYEQPAQQPPIRKAKDVHGDSDVVLAADLQPASKPWVGLTEDEIQSLLSQNRFAVFALVRAIEAKLKEKNT